MHEGHRKRMLERLERSDSLEDHEVLEILLYNALPRINTNELAHKLLLRFGSLDGVFRAGYDDLLSVGGIGAQAAAYLRIVGLCYARTNYCPLRPPEIFNVETFSSFLCTRFGGEREEVLELYCLDGKDSVRFTKTYSTEERKRVVVAPEGLTAFLASHHTKGLVVAHNHPTQPCSPSIEDDEFTAQLQMICALNNIRFYDHIIVGTDGFYSYRLVGKMDDLVRSFDFSKLLGGGNQ